MIHRQTGLNSCIEKVKGEMMQKVIAGINYLLQLADVGEHAYSILITRGAVMRRARSVPTRH